MCVNYFKLDIYYVFSLLTAIHIHIFYIVNCDRKRENLYENVCMCLCICFCVHVRKCSCSIQETEIKTVSIDSQQN